MKSYIERRSMQTPVCKNMKQISIIWSYHQFNSIISVPRAAEFMAIDWALQFASWAVNNMFY